MKDQTDKLEIQPKAADEPQSAGRRSLLKGTATALPAILTLHSGAALARSSNLISTTQYKTSDRETLCLDLRSVRQARGRRGKYDIGEYGTADVYRIPERDYFVTTPRGRVIDMDEKVLCEGGGSASFEEGGLVHNVDLPFRRGGMISLTAASSMADNIITFDV